MVAGRAWKASELRLKSFNDLHTLWYLVVHERNLLATQTQEMRRNGIRTKIFASYMKGKDAMVRSRIVQHSTCADILSSVASPRHG